MTHAQIVCLQPSHFRSPTYVSDMKRPLSFLMLLFAVLLSGPVSAQGPSTLKVDDTIKLEVFGEEDLTTVTKVMKSGEVVLPLIGSVAVSGSTLDQAIEEVTRLYNEKYLVDPKVAITVEDYAEQFFSVIGAVATPGQFAMPQAGQIDLSSALATAGGLVEGANRDRITLKRSGGGSVNFSASEIQRSSGIIVRPGDRVVVEQSAFVGKTVTLLGQVQKSGPLPLPNNGRLELVTAIAQAGGFTELANSKKVTVNRNGRIIELNVREMSEGGSARFYLMPDDIVNVPERFW